MNSEALSPLMAADIDREYDLSDERYVPGLRWVDEDVVTPEGLQRLVPVFASLAGGVSAEGLPLTSQGLLPGLSTAPALPRSAAALEARSQGQAAETAAPDVASLD